MKTHRRPIVVIAGLVALILALGSGAASVSASEKNKRNRQLHVTKDCLPYTGAAGSLLPDHLLESRGDQGRLEGPVRPGSRYSGGDAGQQRRSGRWEWRQGSRPLHTGSGDRSWIVHVLGRDRKPRRVPRPCRCFCPGRQTVGLGRHVQIQIGARSRALERSHDRKKPRRTLSRGFSAVSGPAKAGHYRNWMCASSFR